MYFNYFETKYYNKTWYDFHATGGHPKSTHIHF
jgi:hypothetical protein